MEIVEVCPYCEHENTYRNWNVDKQGFIAVCEHCGDKIFLCDECMHCEDNKEMHCDWHKEGQFNVCMRGAIKDDTR